MDAQQIINRSAYSRVSRSRDPYAVGVYTDADGKRWRVSRQNLAAVQAAHDAQQQSPLKEMGLQYTVGFAILDEAKNRFGWKNVIGLDDQQFKELGQLMREKYPSLIGDKFKRRRGS